MRHVAGGAVMTEADEPEQPQVTEQDEFIAYLMAKVDASESLVSDLLGMMVAIDPTSMAELRDHAFRQVSMVERVGRPTPEAEHYGAVLQKRAQMLEVVVERGGSPWKGTPLIDLAQVRAARR